MDPFESAKNQALIYMIATEGKLARINAAFLKINSTVVLLLTRFLRTSVSRVFILKIIIIIIKT